MPLVDLSLPSYDGSVPRNLRAFLREGSRRIERFRRPGAPRPALGRVNDT